MVIDLISEANVVLELTQNVLEILTHEAKIKIFVDHRRYVNQSFQSNKPIPDSFSMRSPRVDFLDHFRLNRSLEVERVE